MFPFPIATPQGCNIQTFYGASASVDIDQAKSWNKPAGVSHVYMMLIGGGGNGDGIASAGGSGAVTVWYGAAQHVPNALVVLPATSSDSTTVRYRGTSLVTLLTALGGFNTSGGAASTAPAFAASGFYKSTAGQGAASTQIASSTTFLGGGGGNATITGNYGYTVSANRQGFFQMQPIIVGLGGSNNATGFAAVGCGGGVSITGGGPGMVLIASW